MKIDKTIFFGAAASSDGKEGGGSDGKENSTDGGYSQMSTMAPLPAQFTF